MLGVTAPRVRDAPSGRVLQIARGYCNDVTSLSQATGAGACSVLPTGCGGQQTNVLPRQHAWLAVVHPAVLPIPAGARAAPTPLSSLHSPPCLLGMRSAICGS